MNASSPPIAIAGTAEECLAQAAQYRRAGVAELVLTFGRLQLKADTAQFAALLGDRDAARPELGPAPSH